MKDEKVIICGHSGSGKDFLLKGLIRKGLKYLPKHTTRPIRKNETNGLDYIYETNDDFNNLLHLEKVKYYQTFIIEDKKWIYYMTNDSFYNSQLFIMTPYELSRISEEDRSKCFVIYLDIPESIRYDRIKKRNDNNDSIIRRIESDKIDFYNFNNYDMRIQDPNFNIDDIYTFIN